MMQIIPIRDLRDTNKISELCNSTSEPIFVTRNGYGDMVVMSIRTYEETMERVRLYDDIMAGLKELEEGKVVDGPTALKELKEKYGL